jgi:hypothetical protein
MVVADKTGLKGKGTGLIRAFSHHQPGGTEENHKNTNQLSATLILFQLHWESRIWFVCLSIKFWYGWVR